MSSNAHTLQTNYIAQVGKRKIGQYIEYKGARYKIERFPDKHTILGSNLDAESEMPQEVRILINEL